MVSALIAVVQQFIHCIINSKVDIVNISFLCCAFIGTLLAMYFFLRLKRLFVEYEAIHSEGVSSPKGDTYSLCESPNCVRCHKYNVVKTTASQRFKDFIRVRNQALHGKYSRLQAALLLDYAASSYDHTKNSDNTTDTISTLQKPNILLLKGLRSSPVWSSKKFENVCDILYENFEDIKDDFKNACSSYEGWKKNSTPDGCWCVFSIINQGQIVPENARIGKKTLKIVQSIPNLMVDNIFGNVCFSAVEPGTHITPHYGPCNIRLRCHLGLVTPPACTLTVCTKRLGWDEQSCIFFDDSYQHEVKHCGGRFDLSRAILLVDLWHPDVTADEREAINYIFAASPNKPDPVNSVKIKKS